MLFVICLSHAPSSITLEGAIFVFIMKTITITENLYEFKELPAKVKENLKHWFLGRFRDTDEFTLKAHDILELIGFYDVDITYSLSYCQGDGFSFTGKLDTDNVIKLLKANNTMISDASFALFKEYEGYIDIKRCNHNYSHYRTVNVMALCARYDDYDETDPTLEKICEDIEEEFLSVYKTICYKLEREGYNYFYEITEEEMEDLADANDYWFSIDGELYNEDTHRFIKTLCRC